MDHPVKIALKRDFIRAPICSLYPNITFDHQYEHIPKIIQKNNFSLEVTRKRGITLLPSFIVKNEIPPPPLDHENDALTLKMTLNH